MLPLDLIGQAVLVKVLVVDVYDALELPPVFDIAMVISLCNTADYIVALLHIQAGLAGDFFWGPESDFGRVEGLVDSDMVGKINHNSAFVNSED